MNYESLFILLAMAMGVLMTLAFQAHRKALKAIKEAAEAVASVDALSDIVRKQIGVLRDQQQANMNVFTSDYDKRIQKIEIRVDDIGSRVAALQIKR